MARDPGAGEGFWTKLPGKRLIAGFVSAGIALFGTGTAASSDAERPVAVRFFLDGPPPRGALSELPPGARAAFVASVRVIDLVSAVEPAPPEAPHSAGPPYRYASRIEVVTVSHGQAPPCRPSVRGCLVAVHFGSAAPGPRNVFPLEADRKTKSFHILAYVDANGLVAARGFPITGAEYSAWHDRLVEQLIRVR